MHVLDFIKIILQQVAFKKVRKELNKKTFGIATT